VASDASFENDRKPAPAIDGTSQQTPPQAPQAPASNLTHELAQLLAASIAQTQAGRGPAGGIATNSELTSLAKLVAAASAQRTLAPTFKDGLSALSYSHPHPKPAPEPAAAQPLEVGHDDEPMPIPSTWRQPAVHDEDRWLRQQMGAAILGLTAGLMIVVPAVLWLSGWFDPDKAKQAAADRMAAAAAPPSPSVKSSSAPDTSEVRTLKVQVRPVDEVPASARPAQTAAQYTTGSVEPRPATKPIPPPEPPVAAPVPTPARLIEPKSGQEEVLAQAARRIERRDVIGAREVLAGAGDEAQGAILFALAETFDPNMLAAWDMPSGKVEADVAKARRLYGKALDLGVARARARLQALQ
jgi:hypothetical protein